MLVRPDSSPEILQDPRGWLDFARPENAINTRDAWKNHFASWASASQTVALDTAQAAFAPIASNFIEHRQSDLAQERRQLHEWLASRTRELTGTPATTHQQPDLFLANTPNPSPAVPDWLSLSDPLPRLSAFASDQRQPVSRRHEAQTLLALFSKRRQLLDERLAFLPNHVSTLGMLMLVPRSK